MNYIYKKIDFQNYFLMRDIKTSSCAFHMYFYKIESVLDIISSDSIQLQPVDCVHTVAGWLECLSHV